MPDNEPLMTRAKMLAYLNDELGLPIGASSLNKLCAPAVNEGPPVEAFWGKRPLYSKAAARASACFIAFAAGSEKFVHYGALVGVHGASDKSGRESGTATVSMARIVKELGVPPGIIGKMVITPPDEMVWLSPDDLRSMGATMNGKPDQTRQNTATSQQVAPSQLDKNVNANNKPPSWTELVTLASKASSAQNNGKPRFTRVCQPEQKLCTMAIFYNDKHGTETMVRTAEDMSGKIFHRDICTFNKFSDIRSCLDWDSGEGTREMKDANGKWIKVADE